MNYKLSICIPTYNRAYFLEKTLLNIFQQIPETVEVVVYDGASEDGTDKLLKRWSAKYRNFRYKIADTNGGVDRDIENVVDLADADYCWLMSSDDFIAPKSIDEILKIIDGYSPNILIFDRINCDKKMQPKSVEKWLNSNNEVSLYDFRLLDDLYNYLKDVRNLGGIFSYMSSIVVNKSAWIQSTDNSELIGTNYNHVGNILRVLINTGNLIYLHKSLVLCREDNDGFSSNGLPSRFLIDFKGYYEIGQQIFKDDLSSMDMFYDVIRRDHHIIRLIKVRSYCRSIDEWERIEQYLFKLNYKPHIIQISKYIGAISVPIKIIFSLKNLLAKWRK